MRRSIILLTCATLAACSSYQDTPGQVTGIDERGRFKVIGPKQLGKDAAPSRRMVEQALEVCPQAALVSARPSTVDYNIYEYVFRC